MKPEELQMIPATRETARLERNEALGTGGRWWRLLLAILGLAVMLAGGCGYAAEAGVGGVAAERSAKQRGDNVSVPAEGGLEHPAEHRSASPDVPATGEFRPSGDMSVKDH